MERYLQTGDKLTLRGIDGEYTIRDTIGRGSSCVVYAATFRNANGEETEHLLKEFNPRHLDLVRDGALLLHRPEDDAVFEELQTRFEQGFARQTALRTVAELKNYTANVQNIYHDHGTVYVDMTVTAGVSYADVTETSLYDLARRMRVLTNVIGTYHRHGVLHLDIKPSNLFVRPESETCEDVLLFDFDSLVPFREENGRCVLDGAVALSYTTEYAPVELLTASRRHRIGRATDIYEIGEIVFEKVMGRHSTATEHNAWATYDYDTASPLFENTDPAVLTVLDDIFHHTLCTANGRYQTAEELAEQFARLEELTRPDRPYLVSSLPTVSAFFTGRDEEMATIHEALTENNVLILSGIGGIGKSELAKHYALAYKETYHTVLFAPYLHDWTLLVTNDTYVPIAHCHRFEEESLASYYRRKMSVLTALCDEHTLLIVDNLDSLNDDNLPALWTLNCKKIITTRLNLSDVYAGVPQLAVTPLADPMALFSAYYKRPLSEEDRAVMQRIFDITQGLTIEIELLAKQMTAGHFTPSEMLEKLMCGGVGASGAEQVLHTDVDGTVYRGNMAGHIHALFDFSSMNDEEKRVLANLALLPYTGVPVRTFRTWCAIDNLDTVNDLIVRGLVQWEESTETLALHSAIADVCIDNGIRADDVTTMLETVCDRLVEDVHTEDERTLLVNLCLHTSLSLTRTGLENTSVMFFMFHAAQFLAINTALSAETLLNMMERPLEWLQAHQTEDTVGKVFFCIGLYLKILEILEPYLPARTVAKNKARWLPHCQEVRDNAAEADDTDIPDDPEELIALLETQITTCKMVENTVQVKRLSRLLLIAFHSWLMDADLEHVANTSDCRILSYAAGAYHALRKNAKAKALYQLILDSSTALVQPKISAYLTMLTILLDAKEYTAGWILCMDFNRWLEEHFPPHHKLFLQCYRNMISFQSLSTMAPGKPWKMSLHGLLDAFDSAVAYYNAWMAGTTDPSLFTYDATGKCIYQLATLTWSICLHHLKEHRPKKRNPAYDEEMAVQLMNAAIWGYAVTGHEDEAEGVALWRNTIYGLPEADDEEQ